MPDSGMKTFKSAEILTPFNLWNKYRKYNNFVKSKLMIMEYEKKEAYSYSNQIMLDEERRLGIE